MSWWDSVKALFTRKKVSSEGAPTVRRAPYDRREPDLKPVSAILTIVPRHQEDFFIDTCFEEGSALACVVYGYSKPPAEILSYLGADQTKKSMVLSLGRSEYVERIMSRYQARFRISDQARGVAVSAPVTKIAGIAAYKFLADQSRDVRNRTGKSRERIVRPVSPETGSDTEESAVNQNENRRAEELSSPAEEISASPEQGTEQLNSESKIIREASAEPERYDLIVTIVNKGYTDLVMEASRAAGARGGTILTARGTGNPELEKYYGFSITPEKEIVLIIVERKLSDAVLQSIYDAAGLSTNGQGIGFVIPAGRVAGMTAVRIDEQGREEEVIIETDTLDETPEETSEEE